MELFIKLYVVGVFLLSAIATLAGFALIGLAIYALIKYIGTL